ncbi:hypothetical protein [Xenorhabdus bovienii]|uniref:hypothetical protein n=1 Tax=Xenorhabdus bovienii TaxID=40576 RepID=UPI0004DB059C|nr:hypothetical protein [Xenorhabdus bovienii]CDG90084.1 Phage transcriptional regulator (modular protein) [Xenorhabdus bovienii str. feltiae France]CDG93662.1 Phage transcriptional regulator (modular protein) [Xenorhabdus bovienii str. feltiae Florida]
MNPIEIAIQAVGGRATAAKICGRSRVAIHKWIQNGCLPRTEYTGKTNYSRKLAEHSNGKLSEEWLLREANPDRELTRTPQHSNEDISKKCSSLEGKNHE